MSITHGTNKNGTATYTHWLMKSEPETRLENGVDVKVSVVVIARLWLEPLQL